MKHSIIRNLSVILALVLVPGLSRAETLASPNYQVENATLDIGGETSNSTNYSSYDSLGDESDISMASASYKNFLGFVWAISPGVPGVPTLNNPSSSLYNSLDFIIATGGNAVDVNYAIAISSDNFVTTNFIQTDDTIGLTEAWQSYSGWGGISGERVTGLLASTTYKIKVKARYGADSETGYSNSTTATTVAPSLVITFAGISSGTVIAGETLTLTSSSNSIPYGSLTVGSAAIAGHRVTVSTNSVGGYITTLQGDGQLRTDTGNQINSVSGTNATPDVWPVAIATGALGYHTTDVVLCTGSTNRFSANNTFAQITTSPEEVACNSAAVTSEAVDLVLKLQIGALQPAGNYHNILTYITTAKF